MDSTTCNRLHQWRYPLTHGVDEIGTHGFARVDMNVQHHHGLAAFWSRMHVCIHVACAAAARHHVWMERVGCGEDSRPCSFKLSTGEVGIGKVDDLHLSGQDRFGCIAGKSTTLSRHARGARQAGHDGGFFDHKRNDVVSIVDQEVECDAPWQTEHAKHVFDHLVGGGRFQCALACTQPMPVLAADQAALNQRGYSLGDRQPEKVRDARAVIARRGVHGAFLSDPVA